MILANHIYHVYNRGCNRERIFGDDGNYTFLLRRAKDYLANSSVRVIAYCLMPNHWHLVLWPARDGRLSAYMQWLTTTHMRRWHAHRGTRGSTSSASIRPKSSSRLANSGVLTLA